MHEMKKLNIIIKRASFLVISLLKNFLGTYVLFMLALIIVLFYCYIF